MANTVPVYDIQIFRGITYTKTFQVQEADLSGNPTGPFDLTGYELVLVIRDILDEDLILSSNDGPNDEGSYIQIDGDPTEGNFSFKLTPTTNNRVRNRTGDWRIERRAGVDDHELFIIGTATVGSFSAGGDI